MQTVVQVKEGHYESADGLQGYERCFGPTGPARAALLIVHGFAEHGGRYVHVGEYLAERGVAVHAFDLRGNGRAEGERALVRSFGAYLADVRVALGRLREHHPDVPVFVLGHSMGGTVTGLFVTVDRPQVRGVLFSGAGLKRPTGLRGAVQALVGSAGRVFPRLPLIRLNADDVSRDPEVRRLYDSDPLNYRGRMRAGLITAAGRALRHIDDHMDEITLPLLIMHGTEDALVGPDSSRMLYERAASVDKTLKLYEGLYHEILNEPERAQVLADIIAWLDARIDTTATTDGAPAP